MSRGNPLTSHQWAQMTLRSARMALEAHLRAVQSVLRLINTVVIDDEIYDLSTPEKRREAARRMREARGR